MSVKRSGKPSKAAKRSSRRRADLVRLRSMSDAEIARTSPPELVDLPADFWQGAVLVMPVAKEAISLRVDEGVLQWFRSLGPRYQTRMTRCCAPIWLRPSEQVHDRGHRAASTRHKTPMQPLCAPMIRLRGECARG